MAAQETEDGLVIDNNGKILGFSIERFKKDICEGDCCFICGVRRSIVSFNDEHILPDWILRRYDLHTQRLTLPNRRTLTYGGYTIPCCVTCNDLMGETFEVPISRLVDGGFQAVIEHVKQDGPSLLFKWLALIYLKAHLKDKGLRFNLDLRETDEKISDLYDWNQMHHIHCVARSFYTRATLDTTALGSILILQATTGGPFGDFDWRDNYWGRTIHLRLGEVGFIAVLNDARAVLAVLTEKLKRIKGALSAPQFTELLAHAIFINQHLDIRPQFHSSFREDNHCIILGTAPQNVVLEGCERRVFGELFFGLCEGILPALSSEQRDRIAPAIRRGDFTFLFDDNGNFISNSVQCIDPN